MLFAAQILVSRWWLRRFRFGPAEWLGMLICLASVAWAVRTPSPKLASLPLTDLVETP